MTVNRALVAIILFTIGVLGLSSGLWLWKNTNTLHCAYDDASFKASVKKEVMAELQERYLKDHPVITATPSATVFPPKTKTGELILTVPPKKTTPTITPTMRITPRPTPTP